MNKKLAVALTIALSGCVSAPAYAAEHITTVEQSGESKAEFVERVAETMAAFTVRYEFEACGSLAMNADGNLSVKVMTSRQPLACEWQPGDTLAGYTATPETIHSHPKADSIIPRGTPARERHAMKVSLGPNGCDFSPHDLQTGPGYLVACGEIRYHDGKGSIIKL